MGEILGLGCTHRPVMLRRDEDWTAMMRASLDDPDMPAECKDPSRWPSQLREGLGNDFGTAAAGRARKVFRRHCAEARRALDEFKPDVIVMFGDDQYENFKEDIVPPFAVLAYEGQDIQPWQQPRSPNRRQISRCRLARGGDRRRLCLQAAAPPARPRLRKHDPAARRRASW